MGIRKPGTVPPAPDDSYEDKLELLANGRCAVTSPVGDRSTAVPRTSPWYGIALVPVIDIDPYEVVLVTCTDVPQATPRITQRHRTNSARLSLPTKNNEPPVS
ncbi:hypothetical protein [Streptomyces sp. NPDC059786]|uniref:hypothetical protein n=1 Tax=Streptomyces sp. NPDC059786 TaxID=3346946 RepID=UPI00364F73EA